MWKKILGWFGVGSQANERAQPRANMLREEGAVTGADGEDPERQVTQQAPLVNWNSDEQGGSAPKGLSPKPAPAPLAAPTKPLGLRHPKQAASNPIDLVIGLDFGTSSTKVAVRTPFFANARTVVVALRPAKSGLARYLLPTSVSVLQDGTLELEATAEVTSTHADLKLRVMEACHTNSAPREADDFALAAGYMALVLRKVFEWSEGERQRHFRDHSPRWSLNIGIPSAGYDDQAMHSAYSRLGHAAWWLAQQEGPVTITHCHDALAHSNSPTFESGLHTGAFAIIPEVAAEVVGYAKSAMASQGLHVLVDVGASTLDVCSFILHDGDGEDRYALLTADVRLLGNFKLHQYRLQKVSSLLGPRADEALAKGVATQAPFGTMPKSVQSYVSSTFAHSPGFADELAKIDDDWLNQCRATIVGTVVALRRRRDPNSPRWREGLPLFLTGGGSLVGLYRESIEKAQESLTRAMDIKGFRVFELPKPAALANRDVTGHDFRFLSVAFGLSNDRFQIGDIQPPSAIGDVERHERRREEAQLVDKEQV